MAFQLAIGPAGEVYREAGKLARIVKARVKAMGSISPSALATACAADTSRRRPTEDWRERPSRIAAGLFG
jgi:hypothetical protein